MSLLAYIQKMKEEGREVVVAEPRPKIIVNSENQEVKEALIDLGTSRLASASAVGTFR
jgi:hypothetical protein